MINYYSAAPDAAAEPTGASSSEQDVYFMQQALLEAKQAGERDEVPIGAVLVCQGRIIARGHNLTETLTDVTAHAEMQAITAASGFLGGKYLIDCTLYVTVEPCVMCAGALGWAQISRIVYGASDEKRGFQRFAPKALHPKTVVEFGVLEAACSSLVKGFFKKKRG
jgi:tRNA(adenine34) deaminase